MHSMGCLTSMSKKKKKKKTNISITSVTETTEIDTFSVHNANGKCRIWGSCTSQACNPILPRDVCCLQPCPQYTD